MIQYQAKILPDDGDFSVEFPDLPGCFSCGSTLEEALEMAKEALTLYLDETRDPDWRVPEAKTRRGKSFYWVTPETNLAMALLIRKKRHEAGLSQKQLASLLEMSVQQLQKLEMPSKSNPTVKTLEKISQALGAKLTIDMDLSA